MPGAVMHSGASRMRFGASKRKGLAGPRTRQVLNSARILTRGTVVRRAAGGVELRARVAALQSAAFLVRFSSKQLLHSLPEGACAFICSHSRVIAAGSAFSRGNRRLHRISDRVSRWPRLRQIIPITRREASFHRRDRQISQIHFYDFFRIIVTLRAPSMISAKIALIREMNR